MQPRRRPAPAVYEDITEAIGGTPLVRLRRLPDPRGAKVYAKVEYFNPGGSVKDRIGTTMIDAAERSGKLRAGGTVVECTSGNTGMGLALVCAVRGYKLVCTMPDKMSQEKIRLLRAMGAEVIVTPTAVPPDSPESYYSVARRLAEENDNCIWMNQYDNDANPQAHYDTTGPEIWEQTEGKLDVFVAGIGTCGTISGVGRYLKEQNPGVRVVGADPKGSILKHWFDTGEMTEAEPYKIEGIGEDIIPGCFHRQWVDELRTVDDRSAMLTTRKLASLEGLFVGGSCGAAVVVALEVARELPPAQLVVVLLPDSGSRYLSKIYSDDWMRENRFLGADVVTAADVVHAKPGGLPLLITVDAAAPVREAIELMRRYQVSQLPVMRDGQPVGRVTDSKLMAAVLDHTEAMGARVSDFQEPALPLIDGSRSTLEVLKLLGGRDAAVLVGEHGRIAGILTRYDLIDYIPGEE
jgi:cystathionine beta-synthase